MGVEMHRKWSACLRVDCCCRGREEERTTGSRLQMEPCASGGGFGGAVLVCEVLFCSVAAHSTAPVRRLNSRFTSTCPSPCVQIANRIGNPLVARSDFSSHINALGTLRSRLKCAKSQCRSAAEPSCNGPLRGFAERQIQRATAVCKAGPTCSCWGWLRRCSHSKHGSHRCDSCRRFVSRCGKIQVQAVRIAAETEGRAPTERTEECQDRNACHRAGRSCVTFRSRAQQAACWGYRCESDRCVGNLDRSSDLRRRGSVAPDRYQKQVRATLISRSVSVLFAITQHLRRSRQSVLAPRQDLPIRANVLTSRSTWCNNWIRSASSSGFDGSGPWSGSEVSPKLLAVLTSARQSSLGRKPLTNISLGSASISSSWTSLSTSGKLFDVV